VTPCDSLPFQKSFVETLLIPHIRNRKTMFVEYLSHYPNPTKPLMIQGIVTLVTLYLSYTDAGTQTRETSLESRESLGTDCQWFQQVTE
jgi:hypothetical protein